MATIALPRKQRFKVALALADMTALDFCKANEVTQTHLYEVLNGNRVSAPLNAKIDAFIAEHAAPARTTGKAA